MKAMKNRVLEELALIEKEHNVRVLYACESGSRAWGFASPDSDYDVRFLYVRPADWYLTINVEHKRDVIEKPITDELDVSGWDLRKALKLMKKSNPSLVEWLNSDYVYKEVSSFRSSMTRVLDKYYSPRAGFYHYLHMANGNFRDYLKGDRVRLKKYFYVLRPVLCMKWIETYYTIPPLDFETLARGLLSEGGLMASIEALLKKKRASLEADYSTPIAPINEFLVKELERLGSSEKSLMIPAHKEQEDRLNPLFKAWVHDRPETGEAAKGKQLCL
ncbi:nucleotidyltransferase domain-containing protein [Endozoicomonas numazuensis]|uniref:nucleotidyltransferase domain-containing protein n=1 Tax=Endozoicomonas numazuensis TaxID=1137799 RepID=UPI00068C1376|nr:nucleotidyltransferase domain-containing protein [Endozoicomonas numazuensis]